MSEKCKHDINDLMGTNEGIVCRKCGRVFPDLKTLHADLDADRTGKPAKAEPAAEEAPKEKKPKKGKKKE